MIPETKERGPLYWRVSHNGIRGGIIETQIHKNRMAFVKKFMFNDNESFDIAKKICQDKVTRILHFKNERHPYIGRLAKYCLEATIVEPRETFEEPDIRFDRNDNRFYVE
jgi:hypothetical protein